MKTSEMQNSRIILAHSLGNMVVSSVVQDHGYRPAKYFMLNAAVPAEAYDASAGGSWSSANPLVHPDWYDYASRTLSTRWHELFTAADDRSKLTWRGRFADVADMTELFNFHSGTESAPGDLLRFELERDGAWAEVDCRVADRFGNPIPNASIRFYFNVPENGSESEGIVEGKTNQDGRFHARHKTTYACHWRIQKEGYYESRGILPFSNHFSWNEGRKGRWTAEPLSLDVVLDDKSGVDLWHGRIFRYVSFPTNTVVWFDFEAGDCVEPYGKGKNKHVSFYSEGLADPRIGFRSGIGWTNNFVFAVPPNGGLSLLQEKKTSFMPFCHEAPEVFDTQKVEFTYARSRRAVFFDSNPKEGQYIVFQTPHDVSSGQEPHYGVMRNIECWPGGLRMEWFFNKTPGDRRIDGDVMSPFDFKK